MIHKQLIAKSQRNKFLDNILWHLGKIQPYSTIKQQTIVTQRPIIKVFHIFSIDKGALYEDKYIIATSKELELISLKSINISDKKVKRICIISCKGLDGLFIEFNQIIKPSPDLTIWLVRERTIFHLLLDLTKWKQWQLDECLILPFSTTHLNEGTTTNNNLKWSF